MSLGHNKIHYGKVNKEVIYMFKKITVIIFLFIMIMHSIAISAEEFKFAEIFDPQQNKVVKVVQMNTEINNVVAKWIRNVDDIYGKNDPLTDDGYAIRIPLSPGIKVQGKWLNTLVQQVYIIIPEKQPPFFMILENEDKAICFPFKGDIDKLSKMLDFQLRVGRSIKY
jgi:hypothetical protein